MPLKTSGSDPNLAAQLQATSAPALTSSKSETDLRTTTATPTPPGHAPLNPQSLAEVRALLGAPPQPTSSNNRRLSHISVDSAYKNLGSEAVSTYSGIEGHAPKLNKGKEGEVNPLTVTSGGSTSKTAPTEGLKGSESSEHLSLTKNVKGSEGIEEIPMVTVTKTANPPIRPPEEEISHHRTAVDVQLQGYMDMLRAEITTLKDPARVKPIMDNVKALREQAIADAKKTGKEPDFSLAAQELKKVAGNPADVDAGLKRSGKIYPFSTFVGNVVFSWAPSAIGPAVGEGTLATAGGQMGFQGVVTAGTPLIHTASHLCVIPAQAMMESGVSTLRPDDAKLGFKTMPTASADLKKAEQEAKRAIGTPAEAEAHAKLKKEMEIYDKSLYASKINKEGQIDQSHAKAVRLGFSTGGSAASYFYDSKVGIGVQTSGVVISQLYSMHGAVKGAIKKHDQQLKTHVLLLEKDSDYAPENVTKFFQGPLKARCKAAGEYLDSLALQVNQQIAEHQGFQSKPEQTRYEYLRDLPQKTEAAVREIATLQAAFDALSDEEKASPEGVQQQTKIAEKTAAWRKLSSDLQNMITNPSEFKERKEARLQALAKREATHDPESGKPIKPNIGTRLTQARKSIGRTASELASDAGALAASIPGARTAANGLGRLGSNIGSGLGTVGNHVGGWMSTGAGKVQETAIKAGNGIAGIPKAGPVLAKAGNFVGGAVNSTATAIGHTAVGAGIVTKELYAATSNYDADQALDTNRLTLQRLKDDSAIIKDLHNNPDRFSELSDHGKSTLLLAMNTLGEQGTDTGFFDGFTLRPSTIEFSMKHGLAKAKNPAEWLRMFDQKFSTSFQAFVGGSSMPQVISSSVKLTNEIGQLITGDPNWKTPVEAYGSAQAVSFLIGVMSAYGAPYGINNKNSHGMQLKEALANNELVVPATPGGPFTMAAVGTALRKTFWNKQGESAAYATPVGMIGDLLRSGANPMDLLGAALEACGLPADAAARVMDAGGAIRPRAERTLMAMEAGNPALRPAPEEDPGLLRPVPADEVMGERISVDSAPEFHEPALRPPGRPPLNTAAGEGSSGTKDKGD